MSTALPTLTTDRLIVRPFTQADAKDVQRLAGADEIAATTTNIPHPYEDGMAETWIETHRSRFDERRGIDLAITMAATGDLVGAIGFATASEVHRRAEMGWWVGVPYWRQGICTEAAAALAAYSFDELELHRLTAHHLTRNPASGRVMQKIGMSHEGTLRQHIVKSGVFEDIEVYGLLATEFTGA